MLNITQAVTRSIRNTFNYTGRARRSEYWWTWLFVMVLIFALTYVDHWMIPVISDADTHDYYYGGWKSWLLAWKYSPLSTGLYYLALPILIAVTARRMHDIGRNAWIGVLPIIAFEAVKLIPIGDLPSVFDYRALYNPILVAVLALLLIIVIFEFYSLVLCLLDSHRKTNRYGPSPKYSDEADIFD